MIQGREVGIPVSITYMFPDLTGIEVQIAGEAAEERLLLPIGVLWLTHRAIKTSSRITKPNTYRR